MRTKYEYRSASREVFKRFKEKHPEVDLKYTDWCNIVYSFNYGFRDYCLETGRKAKFPYGIGVFCITKFKQPKIKVVDGVSHINMNVDWKKTKEKGFRVFHMNNHTEGFGFRWYWIFGTQRFFQSEIWSFKPSRVSSRLINHYIKQNYSSKYLDWKSIKN